MLKMEEEKTEEKKVKKSAIARGKKWADLRAQHEALGHDKEIEWMDSQKAIVEDEKAYADSIKPAEEPEEKPKGKKGGK